VKVNEVVGVAGFVVPGMRVDVLITGLPPGGNALDGPKVRTLLQNIQVLSAGVNFQQDREGKPEQAQVVNLLVTPAQAELLSLASNETHIQLVLLPRRFEPFWQRAGRQARLRYSRSWPNPPHPICTPSM
jgi:pilus assembly protein CpaB